MYLKCFYFFFVRIFNFYKEG
ncbi:TPA: DUF4492 domain-containing protein, partial [Campylobacter coli]|nr:DUF4492 domain-containing protein [Campylobacter coli]EAL4137298.1 DUF4492 domain-containing protein [Campylobacter coli]EEO9353781.1 DUF4492 domain-containing protein [Campylobacter coli]EJP6840342.1 DUF4492 domain-containing protein [Campylobacter coli]EKM4598485.1 DUF4492 domain-containing protein [Campylobacter coli]